MTGSSAGAQQAPALPQGVMDKPRPDYDAKGLPLGDDWLLYPALSITANYDDNIYRLQEQHAPDWYFESTPTARLLRKWGDTAVASLFATIDSYSFARFQQLDLIDWSVGGGGSLKLGKSLTATASGFFGEAHEDFSAAELIDRKFEVIGRQFDYTRYYHGHADTLIEYKPDAWNVSAGATFDRFDWRPTAIDEHGGIVLFQNTDRNETLFDPYVRASYELEPGYSLFARAQYDLRHFDQPTPAKPAPEFRSSSGYRVDAGLTLRVDKAISGDVYLGYLRQDFHQPLPDFAALDYGAALDWYARPDLTVHLTAARAASDLVVPGTSITDDRVFHLAADYEARPNVIVQAFAGYTVSRLITEAHTRTRTDRYPTAGVTVRYLINRYASAQLGYVYSSRHSDPNPANLDYRDQTFTAGFLLHI